MRISIQKMAFWTLTLAPSASAVKTLISLI
jgi:hypothetical protein